MQVIHIGSSLITYADSLAYMAATSSPVDLASRAQELRHASQVAELSYNSSVIFSRLTHHLYDRILYLSACDLPRAAELNGSIIALAKLVEIKRKQVNMKKQGAHRWLAKIQRELKRTEARIVNHAIKVGCVS